MGKKYHTHNSFEWEHFSKQKISSKYGKRNGFKTKLEHVFITIFLSSTLIIHSNLKRNIYEQKRNEEHSSHENNANFFYFFGLVYVKIITKFGPL